VGASFAVVVVVILSEWMHWIRVGRENHTAGETLFEAFAIFCREDLEVEPETLIKALFGHVMSGIGDLKARREKFDTEADEEVASEYAAAISEVWQRYLQHARRLSG
jgi:hypothetical protein